MSKALELPESYHFVDLPCGRTHYQVDGPSDGKKLLLIHGATVPAWEFDRIVPYLNEAGFQTIRADLLGHGYSERPDVSYQIDVFRDQLIQLLDALTISDTVDILGHSMGAAVGASMINQQPARFGKLILAAPLVNYVANMPALKWFKIPLLGKMLTQYYAMPMIKRRRRKRYAPIENGRFVAKFQTQFLIPGFERTLLSILRDDVLGDQTERYQLLNLAGNECLILRGSHDEIVTAEQTAYLQSILSTARVTEIHRTPHSFILTHPDRVAAEVTDFLL